MPARSVTDGAGKVMHDARSASVIPATMGTPRSVDHAACAPASINNGRRSEEHTSELQSLMRISYAVFCLKKKKKKSKRNKSRTITIEKVKIQKTIEKEKITADNMTTSTTKAVKEMTTTTTNRRE